MRRYKKNTLIRLCIIVALAFIGHGCERRDITLTADQLIARGQQFNAEGKVDKAVESYRKAILLRPDSSALHFEFGVLLYAEYLKSYDKAQMKLLADVIRRPNKDFSKNDISKREGLLVRYGYRKEYYISAKEEFSETLKYNPSHWEARYYIAADLFKKQKYEQAIVEFNELNQLKPDYANNFTFLGEAYLNTGKYQLAINTLEKASDMNPSAQHYYVLGLAYRKTGNWKKVYEMVGKLKEMNSDFHNDLFN
ncbi:MAG: hypothetical protein A2X56_15095 [Nitrospirae bacterium GWC2_57_13]|nr:MAG: hypothetical protein A2072_03170 [Nitrospirae bacterium GWC1_57_7]OGW28035.1 MAG: hypothetical protein A2X56_15095 [Nitrospirae bacterium GWC2_57_13]OGW46804.1 MAG: hypothetical protein A2X57_01645 [Nitrospirae bacterium GWD2_57_8]HAS53743.1 hypothetical protein [Nitrospiraceae bacterium]